MSSNIVRKILLRSAILLVCINVNFTLQAQDSLDTKEVEFEINGDPSERIVVPFELINNLIVIEASINGSNPLKFILDTGVSKTLVTTIPAGEGIYVEKSRTVSLSGLGAGESVEAYYSTGNDLQIESVVGRETDILFMKEDIFRLSSFMGTNVHGLIGYDLFANFAVEINYKSKEIYLWDPDSFTEKFIKLPKHRKWHEIPISIEDKKVYLDVMFTHQPGAEAVPLKLLVDTGASSAFLLYHLSHEEVVIPQSNIETFIGVGLSGRVHGYIGRVENISLLDMNFEKPVVAYPDSASIRRAFGVGDRNGSLGGEILRRFKVIFHYPNEALYIRKNSDFGDDFDYNMSGIELNTPIPDLPFYVVSEVRENSPAAENDIQAGDIIKFVNGKSAANFGLNEMINILQKREGRKVKLSIERDSVYKDVSFRLENQLKVDSDLN